MALKNKFENVELVICEQKGEKNYFLSCDLSSPTQKNTVETTVVDMHHIDEMKAGAVGTLVVTQFTEEGMMCKTGDRPSGLHCIPMDKRDELNI